MYIKPETVDTDSFAASTLDYIQLGWLLVWVLANDENDDYHSMKWEHQPKRIQTDLVCQGVYLEQALEQSVVADERGFHFLTLLVETEKQLCVCYRFLMHDFVPAQAHYKHLLQERVQ